MGMIQPKMAADHPNVAAMERKAARTTCTPRPRERCVRAPAIVSARQQQRRLCTSIGTQPLISDLCEDCGWKTNTMLAARALTQARPAFAAAPQRGSLVILNAHKKGSGSTKNGRDSNAQRRGVKVYGGQPVKAGGIIVRQVGSTVRCRQLSAGVVTLGSCEVCCTAAAAGPLGRGARRRRFLRSARVGQVHFQAVRRASALSRCITGSPMLPHCSGTREPTATLARTTRCSALWRALWCSTRRARSPRCVRWVCRHAACWRGRKPFAAMAACVGLSDGLAPCLPSVWLS